MMRNILFLFLPLLIFGYPEALLEKAAMVNEFVENPYTNYYFNPAYLTELKERFIGLTIYSDGKNPQFTSLIFVNKIIFFPYALIFNNFENENLSEKSLTFIIAKKGKDYAYGFKGEIGKQKTFYENKFSYEKSDFYYDGYSFGDSSPDYFAFDIDYTLEESYFKNSYFTQTKSDFLYLPFSFYLKRKDLEMGFDLKASQEKLIINDSREEVEKSYKEEYTQEKEGDTVLNYYYEELISEKNLSSQLKISEETSKIFVKDIAIFLKKKFKGLKDKKLLFGRFGYLSEIKKGIGYYQEKDSSYKADWELVKELSPERYEENKDFSEEGKGVIYEEKKILKGKRENVYGEMGFGCFYYFNLFKFDHNLFLGIREKVDYLKETGFEGKTGFYLGNKLEKDNFTFFPIFSPIFYFKKDSKEYNYNIFLNLSFKIFDFLNFRFSYLWQSDFCDFKDFKIPKIINKRWVLSCNFNY
jgi:hypothetical protein